MTQQTMRVLLLYLLVILSPSSGSRTSCSYNVDCSNIPCGRCTDDHQCQGCDAGDACTEITCEPFEGSTGICESYKRVCDDANPCTQNTCDPTLGCLFDTPTDCDDHDPCTVDTCEISFGCVHTPKACDDKVLHTVDSCNPSDGRCVHTALDCDDQDPCTLDEVVLSDNFVPSCKNVPLDCNAYNPCPSPQPLQCDSVYGCVFPCDDPITIWQVRNAEVTALDLSVIRTLAQTATAITIASDTTPSLFVTTTPNSTALENLKKGVSLSVKSNAEYDISQDWSGPAGVGMMATSCDLGYIADFVSEPYHACGNPRGLHLIPEIATWDWSSKKWDSVSIKMYRIASGVVPIWRCTNSGNGAPLYSSSLFAEFVKRANSVIIHTTENPQEYVKAGSNSYALQALKAGKSLDHTVSGGSPSMGDWQGTKVRSLPLTCGTQGQFASSPYWACGNSNGLHLTSGKCTWAYNNDNVNITVAVGINPLPERLVKIWSCDGINQNILYYPMATIKKLAKYATGLTIMNRVDPTQYVTTYAGSPVLESLKAGQSVSFGLDGSYNKPSYWEGPMVNYTENSCGWPRPFNHAPFWACGNGQGIHLTVDLCTWNYSAPATPGGIGVYLHLSRSVMNELAQKRAVGNEEESGEEGNGEFFYGIGVVFVLVGVYGVVSYFTK